MVNILKLSFTFTDCTHIGIKKDNVHADVSIDAIKILQNFLHDGLDAFLKHLDIDVATRT